MTKQFEDYKDGDTVSYKGLVYQAYKSRYTHNAFRLKGNGEDVIADISEISPVMENYEEELPRGYVDSDADATGIYHIYDPHGQD